MDLQTIGVIATNAIAILSSFFDKAGQAAVQKVGVHVHEVLRAPLSQRPAAEETLAELEKNPQRG